ncbi:NADP-dependent oxidoreductase domain-containing protein [Geopyxis carbonaria]|nr:NADP-dependent oxidoreductase domain-containing protein [Geopyxis carbonaria]
MTSQPLTPAEKPNSLLGFHRILSPTAGVRVSPLCLGAMNFGDTWQSILGTCSKSTTFDILDTFLDAGGNFIDTANDYQSGQSEAWLGEWMASRQCRDQIVLATKFTMGYLSGTGGEKVKSNFQGNHAKSLRVSLDASLRKLQTEYVDILYVHWWDFSTSIPELMQALNRVVAAGKVLYLGISDTPAWIVSKANEYARGHGLAQFAVYQGLWNAAVRDVERDILPMVEAEGMALAPWGVLGQGKFKPNEDGRNLWKTTETEQKVAKCLAEVAAEKGTALTSVAIAYVMHKAPYVFPIVGGRSVAHLEANIEALGLELSDADVARIEGAVPFDVGFPMNLLFGFHDPEFRYSSRMTTKDVPLVRLNAHIETPEKVRPIKAVKLEDK